MLFNLKRLFLLSILAGAGYGILLLLSYTSDPTITPAQAALIQKRVANIRPLLASSDDWPMLRHDAQNTGLSADKITPPLQLLWKTHSYQHNQLLLASGGVVAVTGHDDPQKPQEVSLYDRTGHRAWHLANAAAVYLKGARIVVEAIDGNNAIPTCYDWHTGKVLWSQPQAPGLGQYCERDGRLYCSQWLPANRNVVRILNLEDGKLLKEHVMEESWGGGIGCDGEHVFVGLSHWMHALDVQTLEPAYAFYNGGTAYPMRTGSQLISQGFSHGTTAYDLTTKHIAWGVSAWRGSAHALALSPNGQRIVIETHPTPELVIGYDVETGKAIWQRPLLAGSYGSLGIMAMGSSELFYTPGWHRNNPISKGIFGGFYCLEAATGKLIWKYEKPGVQGSAIIASEGRIYALDSVGTLYCFAASS